MLYARYNLLIKRKNSIKDKILIIIYIVFYIFLLKYYLYQEKSLTSFFLLKPLLTLEIL